MSLTSTSGARWTPMVSPVNSTYHSNITIFNHQSYIPHIARAISRQLRGGFDGFAGPGTVRRKRDSDKFEHAHLQWSQFWLEAT